MSYPAEPDGGGNIFTRKVGPLPFWGWMAVGLLLAIAFYAYNKNKTAKTASTSSPSTVNTPGGVDASLVPQFVNQVYNQEQPPNITLNNTTNATTTVAPPPTQDHDHESEDHDTNKPKPGPAPKPAPKPQGGGGHKQAYTTVKVGQFPGGQGGQPSASQNSFGPGTAAWNTTLWGIATHYNVPGGYQALAKLNGISNPNLIYPGQSIKVPVQSG